MTVMTFIILQTEVRWLILLVGFWDDQGYYYNREGFDIYGGYYDENFNYIPSKTSHSKYHEDSFKDFYEDNGDIDDEFWDYNDQLLEDEMVESYRVNHDYEVITTRLPDMKLHDEEEPSEKPIKKQSQELIEVKEEKEENEEDCKNHQTKKELMEFNSSNKEQDGLQKEFKPKKDKRKQYHKNNNNFDNSRVGKSIYED